MPKIYIPVRGAEDWKGLIAHPELHWKVGRSARTLAHCWQDADGFPAEFAQALRDAGWNLELLLALPEHRVSLPGGARASQTNLFLLARNGDGEVVSIIVEGKVGEPFGPRVSDWLIDDPGRGKQRHLVSLLETLGLPPDTARDQLRYQLLHRTAAAMIEAQRFHARHAMMVVHAFGNHRGGYDAYAEFAEAIGATPERGRITPARDIGTVSLSVGWIDGAARYLEA
jgi:hypothetical protein